MEAKEKVICTHVAQWRVNTVGLLTEIMNNPGTAILHKPINIFKDILAQVSDRAAELNDPQLNALMCRLALYSVSDPYDPEYDANITDETIKKGRRIV